MASTLTPIPHRIKLGISVHVIELRDIPGKDSSGLSDPFVRVTVAGDHRKQTAIKHGQTSCAFDELFRFPEVELSGEDYVKSMIRIEVFDANVFFRNELIGQFAFQIQKGFVKLTVTVVGPGDAPPAHPKLIANQPTLEELQQARKFGVENRSRISAPSSGLAVRRGYAFVAKIFRAEYLPKECDVFAVVRFNGVVSATPIKRKTRAPDWNYALVIPVHTPLFSDVVEVEIWDKGVIVPDEMLASFRVNFSSLLAEPYSPTWFNMYGVGPEEIGIAQWWTDNVVRKGKLQGTAFLGRTLCSMSASLTDSLLKEEKPCAPLKGGVTARYVLWIDVHRARELIAPTFGGQFMIEVRFGPGENTRRTEWCNLDSVSSSSSSTSSSSASAANSNTGCVTFYDLKAREREKTEKIKRNAMMKSTASGKDDHASASGGATSKSPVSSSNRTQAPNPASNSSSHPSEGKEGEDDDEEEEEEEDDETERAPPPFTRLDAIEAILPLVDPKTDSTRVSDQLYDIVVSLYTKNVVGTITRVGFVRIKPVDVWGFRNDPEWHAFQGHVESSSGKSESQGFVLLSAQFGPKNEAPVRRPNVEERRKETFQLRAYVYQARGIQPTNEDALASTHVTVSLAGKTARLMHTQPSRYKEFSSQFSPATHSVIKSLRYSSASNPQPALQQQFKIEEKERLPRTTTSADTLNPTWYETLMIESVELPKQLALSDDIELCVRSSKDGSVLGRARFPTELATTKFWPRKARARWLRLVRRDGTKLRFDTTHDDKTSVLAKRTELREEDLVTPIDLLGSEDVAGDLLIKLELMPLERARRKPWYARHLWPKVRRARVQLVTVGLRGSFPTGSFLEVAIPSLPDVNSMLLKARTDANPNNAMTNSVASTAATSLPAGGDAKSTNTDNSNNANGNRRKRKQQQHQRGNRSPGRAKKKTVTFRGEEDDEEDEEEDEEEDYAGRSSREEGSSSYDYYDDEEEEDDDEEEDDTDEDEEEEEDDEASERRGRGARDEEGTANSTAIPRLLTPSLPASPNARRQNTVELALLEIMSRPTLEAESNAKNSNSNASPGALANLYNFGESGVVRWSNKRHVTGRDKEATALGLTFFNVVSLPCNFPEDAFYTSSMTVRVLDAAPKSSGLGSVTAGSAGSAFSNFFASLGQPAERTPNVLGSCVVTLRPRAFALYETIRIKPVDRVFQLPKLALTRDGKDRFEAIARRDSMNTMSTNSVANNEQQLAEMLALEYGDGRAAPTTQALYDSDVTSLTDPNDDFSLSSLHGEGFGEDLPSSIAVESDDLNLIFDAEVNPKVVAVEEAKASEIARSLLTLGSTDNKALLTNGESTHGDHGAEGSSTTSATNPKSGGSEANVDADFEELVRKNALKMAQRLPVEDEYAGVHWPAEAPDEFSRYGASVPDVLENSAYVTSGMQYECFKLYVGRIACIRQVGTFKASVIVVPESDDVAGGANAGTGAWTPFGGGAMEAVEADASRVDLRLLHPRSLPLFSSPTPPRGPDDPILPPSVVPDEPVAPLVRIAEAGPQTIKLRVYVVQGTDLWSTYPETCRPYLCLRILPNGKDAFQGAITEIRDAHNLKIGTSPFFGSWYELDVRFPDWCALEVQVYEKGGVGGDILIGTTRVDLEDRWFNSSWQGIKAKRKFVREFRPLYNDSVLVAAAAKAAAAESGGAIASSVSQSDVLEARIPRGKLEMWCEMYTAQEAVEATISDIRLPREEMWELRLVVWETKGVPPPDTQTSISMYVTGELSYKNEDGTWSEEQYHSTDTHYNVRNGMGLFNWRMKFKFKIPCRFPRLTLKVWGTEWLSLAPNQAVGVAVIDLDFLTAIATSTTGDVPVERPRTLVKLTQDAGLADRGEVDIQMTLVRERVALMDPVGNARDPPNKDPFLPEPKRESFWANFFANFSLYRCLCCLILLAIPAIALAIVFTK